MDGLAFGFHEKGEPMTLAEFRPLFKGVIIGNCGYTKESAEERIAEGRIKPGAPKMILVSKFYYEQFSDIEN